MAGSNKTDACTDTGFNAAHLAARSANHVPLTPLDFLQRTVAVYPDRPAIAWNQNTWSYRDFGAIVARMAAWLKDQGVGPGDVVSLILGNRPETLAAHFAVPAIGAVLNTINTRLTPEEIAYILDHAGTRIIITDDLNFAALPQDQNTQIAKLCTTPGDSTGIDFFDGDAPPLDLMAGVTDEWQKIALNYTSGTTGRPKGVVYTHRGAALNALGNVLTMGFTTQTRYLWTLPMFHCNGWCHTWAVTAAGGLHVCLDRVDPNLILKTIADRDITHMCCAPVVLYMLLDQADGPCAQRVLVGTGGAAPTPSLLAGLNDLGFDLRHLYGLTESYGPATINIMPDPAPADLTERATLFARQGQRHLLSGAARVEDDNGQPVPADGETLGEIVLSGNTIMAGYLGDEAATDTAFAGRKFHTGDLAVMHENGQIEIRDRAKDIIITGGENVSSLEIEAVLHTHPDILLAAVVAAPHPKWGETPWAFIEPKEGRDPSAQDLDSFCREHLAGFKRPKRFVLGTLPKTATGKIQKFALRDQARRMAVKGETT